MASSAPAAETGEAESSPPRGAAQKVRSSFLLFLGFFCLHLHFLFAHLFFLKALWELCLRVSRGPAPDWDTLREAMYGIQSRSFPWLDEVDETFVARQLAEQLLLAGECVSRVSSLGGVSAFRFSSSSHSSALSSRCIVAAAGGLRRPPTNKASRRRGAPVSPRSAHTPTALPPARSPARLFFPPQSVRALSLHSLQIRPSERLYLGRARRSDVGAPRRASGARARARRVFVGALLRHRRGVPPLPRALRSRRGAR